MLKNKLEALLFSSGRKMNMEELSKLSNAKPVDIQSSLTELKKEYDEKNSSVMLVNEGDSWKLTVREQFLPLVQKIVTETELTKTVMETLAVIAFKYPIKQSNLIKIRTNKAYDHLKELEEMGYITRQKHGRTNLIKLTQKFFEYFDLPEDKLKGHFNDFASIAKAIEDKEMQIEKIKHEQRAQAQEEKQKYESIEKEKLGNLEVVDESSEEEQEKERERIQKTKEEDRQLEEKPGFKGEGIKLSKEEEKIVDEKVEKILHPPKEEQETQKEPESKKEEESKPEEEPKDLLEASMEEKEEKKE
jgi:segregation and condensation protein B|tara:strand:- start:3956 stop:4864 length:909 start_codon:yes stop_codon:yes gene_type:complete